MSEWIPCSERLPKAGKEVFVYLFGDSPYIAWVDKNGVWNTEDFEVDDDNRPVAWMPLPEPYKGGKKMDDLISRQAAIDCEYQVKIINDIEYVMLSEVQMKMRKLPSAQPELDEWCTDCKEYDAERHCCPMWNKVIRDTMDEIRQNAEENWDKVEVVRCKDCKYHVEFPSKCNKLHLTMLPNDYCSYGEREYDER